MSDLPHTRLPVQPCPVCGYRVDSHTTAFKEQHAPTPGDYSVCLNCAAILHFDAQLSLRQVIDLVAEDVPDDTKFELRRVQQHVQTQIRERSAAMAAYDRDWWTQEAMIRKGGEFIHRLGAAARAADVRNLTKIKRAFPEYWREYEVLGRGLEATERESHA